MSASAAHRFLYPSPSTSRRSFLALSTGALLSLPFIGSKTALAFDGAYEPGQEIEGDYTFHWGTYVAHADDAIYHYATGTDGYAYYATHDGSSWSEWSAAGEQEVNWDPAPVSWEGGTQAYYTGADGYIYEVSWDSYGAAAWEDLSGEYTYDAAPYATVYEESIHLYGNSTDGNVYHKSYTADGWGEWAAINETYASKPATKPYAVSWDDHENAFWCDDDGKVYWNRYDYAAQSWTGAREIPADYAFKYAPYAVGYAPETSLYAYGVNIDGAPAYNVFDGEGWAGWQLWEVDWTATYRPNAYVYEDTQHVVYTSDDGNAYYTQYNAEGWEGEWQDLGGNYAYDAHQYSYNDGLYLTYTGEDGKIYYRNYAFEGDGSNSEPTEEPGY